jgi:NTE family protein
MLLKFRRGWLPARLEGRQPCLLSEKPRMKKWVLSLVVVACAVALSCGCARMPSRDLTDSEEPRVIKAEGLKALHPGPKFALVLSGGGLRGYAHLGAMMELIHHGIKPDVVIGTSAGAFAAIVFAKFFEDAAAAGTTVMDLTFEEVASPTLPRLPMVPGALGIFRFDRLENYLTKRLQNCLIERLPIPVFITVTNLDTGLAAVINRGDCARAVHASMAVPGMVSPVLIRGERFIDGQITSPLPADLARQLGAHWILAIDVVYPPDHSSIDTILDVPLQSWNSSLYALSRLQARSADLVIRPKLPRKSQLGSEDRERLIEAGATAMRRALPEISRAIASQGR